MNMVNRYFSSIITVTALFLLVLPAYATKQKGNEVSVTYVQGTVEAYSAEAKNGVRLRKNDRIAKEKEVRVGEKSRVELRFPDGTIMRLAENSRLSLNEIIYDRKSEEKSFQVSLALGRIWANVKKLATTGSAVEVKTVNAIAGVRGTTYQVNVDPDESAVVKVYDGTVYVAGQPREMPKPAAQIGGPVQVPGPHEVPPSYHEVTMDEGLVIVQSMQQISISPDGIATKPQSFDAQEDADDWVKWNQERDAELKL
ncbi:MAG TPA: hypothetical protein DCS05_10235 [Nitrospiraceae bacterium]|nr:hypothetical protein [Nitrospiraceae bacterium]